RHTRFSRDWSSDVCSSDLGVFRSLDAAASWHAANHGLRAAAVLSIAVDPTRPRRLYAVAVNGIFRSGNGGATWTLLLRPWGDIRSEERRVGKECGPRGRRT